MTSVEVFDMPKAEGDGRKIKRGSSGRSPLRKRPIENQ
jgi:hypothetical protein